MPRAKPGDVIAPALILAAVLVAYANALPASFQYDDWNVIVGDARVQSLAAWWKSFPGIRPLLKLSFALNHTSGFGPAGFHAVNVGIHALSALAVFALLSRVVCRAGGIGDVGVVRGVALAGALLFALHPVQTEAVTYVSGRSSSLSALFSLGSILCWMRGRERHRPWLVHGASPVLLAAAVAVKEIAVAVPFALALLWATDPAFGSGRNLEGAEDQSLEPATAAKARLPRGPRGWRAFLDLTAGHWLVLAVAAGAALTSPVYRHLLDVSLQTRSLGENLRTQAHAVAWLAGQLVCFHRLNADPMLPAVPRWTAPVAMEAGAIVLLIVTGFMLRRRSPALSFGILWFFLWLAPTNSLLPRLDVANDRQLYLALVGPAWLAALAAGRLAGSKRRALRRVATVGIGGLCVLLAACTVRRNAVYATEVGFWRDVTAKAPHNARAFTNLGYAYALACHDGEAEAAFLRALELDPADRRTAVNLKLLRTRALRPPGTACGSE